MSFPLLTAVAVVPAVGAIATAALPAAKRNAAKWLALLFSLATFALALVVAFRFDPGAKGPSSSPNPMPGSATSASATNSVWTVSRSP